MALEAERRRIENPHALIAAVEQGAMRDARVFRQRRLVDRKAVVLARDQYAARLEVLHRMVRAVMTELHLQRLRTHRKAENLVTQADAEQRQLLRHELARRANRVIARLRI